jgi:hypothetical protein
VGAAGYLDGGRTPRKTFLNLKLEELFDTQLPRSKPEFRSGGQW